MNMPCRILQNDRPLPPGAAWRQPVGLSAFAIRMHAFALSIREDVLTARRASARRAFFMGADGPTGGPLNTGESNEPASGDEAVGVPWHVW